MPNDVENMKNIIRERLLTKTLKEWLEIFNGKDVCVEPVLTMKEALLEDEHIKDRKLVVDVEVPNSNGKVIKQMASPIKLSECPVNYKETGYPRR